ncbi:hypothetical protein LPJ61_000976 [Coemansia biformis]|uniref:Pentacotripeptide-repeat region of PRORP domain-containing protein n=1 Tax=Coemansia biformis TaxID=1286918 RepID=A0A9W7YG24_9FUNG|nr:hypothetical protein LPJ61_000976 [Coemansia biformis]
MHAARSTHEPAGGACTQTDREWSGEVRMAAALRGLAQTGSPAQREAVWGLYERMATLGTGAHRLSLETLLLLIELLAGDTDTVRVLGRISSVLGDVTSRDRFTDSEMGAVRRLWDEIAGSRKSPTVWAPFVKARRPAAGARRKTEAPMLRAAAGVLDSGMFASTGPSLAPRTAAGAAEADLAVVELRRLIQLPPICVNPAGVWRAYRAAIDTQRTPAADGRLTGDDMKGLIAFCSSLGKLAGERFLAQIEVDLATDPDLFPGKYQALIYTYAKLGLLEHSRRLYAAARKGDSSDTEDSIDWHMCCALVVSMRHREGYAMFDRLVERDRATPHMYAMLIRECVLMQNRGKAFALFDDMCSRGIQPTCLAANMLATACALEKDAAVSSLRLRSVIAWMRSWRMSPDSGFFIGLLKGYDRTGQYDMFDGLLARLRARNIQSIAELDKVVMNNAARRNNSKLTVSMAELAAQLPNSVPSVVRALCSVDRPDCVRRLVDLAQWPENNITANLRLELAMSDPAVAIKPLQLQNRVLGMLGHGFTPTFRLSKKVLDFIWLYGGRQLAIEAYEKLARAGIHKSIDILALALRLYARSPTPELGIGMLDELCDRWTAADLAVVAPPFREISSLLSLVIAKRGVDAAQEMFDLLASLPTVSRQLPFAPLVEYYINHGMQDRSRALILRAVQQEIPVGPRGANVCCRHLAEVAGLSDLANFMRHLQRTHELQLVADDVFVKFFALCAAEYKVADFEWVLGALVHLGRSAGTWRAIVDCLAASSMRLLSAMLYVVVGSNDGNVRMATMILRTMQKSPRRAVIANMMLETLWECKVQPTATICHLALTAIVTSRQAQMRQAGTTSGPRATKAYLAATVGRHIDTFTSVGVRPQLLTTALHILASDRRHAHNWCLDILGAMPHAQRDVRFYGAIAQGCVRFGSVEGINDVLRAMEADGVEPTAELFSTIIECYTNLRPRSTSEPAPAPAPEQYGATPHQPAPAGSHGEDTGAGAHEPPPPEDASRGVRESDDSPEARGFYEACLARALSVWDELAQYGLSPSYRSCVAVLSAFAKAKKRDQGEDFVGVILANGFAHTGETARGWIRLRLATGDTSGALRVFSAIDNAARCERLARRDARYLGLDAVAPTPRMFAEFVLHYVACGELEHAVAIIRALHRQRLRAEPWVYTRLLKELAHCDLRNMLVEVLKEMLAAGARPDSAGRAVVREYADFTAHIAASSGRPVTPDDGAGSDR